MQQAVIVDALRTPIAKASPENGYFRDVRAEDLSAHAMRLLVDRVGIDPHLIEDIRWGCVQQQGEQGYDIARIASLIAELPIEIAAVTLNRNCASGLQAINDCAMSIMSGCEDIQIAGGVEHMEHIPAMKGYDACPSLFRRHSEAIMHMGLTAEYLAAKYQIPRQRQDESHRIELRGRAVRYKAQRMNQMAHDIVFAQHIADHSLRSPAHEKGDHLAHQHFAEPVRLQI